MIRSLFILFILFCFVGIQSTYAQLKTSILIQSTDEDERIDLSIDRSIYFPGDTVLLVIQRNDNSATAGIITPTLLIEGVTLKSIGRLRYATIIPRTATPGSYPIGLRVTDAEGRRFRYQTDCVVAVEEYEDVEQLSRYVSIIPETGGNSVRTATTVTRDQVRNLLVRFHRDSIRERMGPQFLRITTTIMLREGAGAPSYERRVVTYRSHGDPYKDRAMFDRYRAAYGPFANVRPEELEKVLVPVDTLPDWAILGIHIEPDYSIKIGAVDRANSVTEYFRVKGPTLELGFSLAIPKVFYDTRADDQTQYGNTSAMIRLYFIGSESGNRFPVNVGIGVFGVYSPVDVGIGRGGFALSTLLDLAELVRIANVGFSKKVNIGLEVDPFIPIGRKVRVLLAAEAGITF